MVSEKCRPQCERSGFFIAVEPQRRKADSRHGPRNGKVVNDDKGYGFITPDEGSEDVFVQYSGIASGGFKSLDKGAKVSYEATQWSRGMQADNVSAV